MLFLLLVDLLSMLLHDYFLRISEVPRLLLLMLLQSLVAGCVLKHALRVLIPLCLELMVVLFRLHLELLFELVFNLVLAGLELFDLALDHELLTGELLVELLDLILLVICTCLLIYTRVAWITSSRQFVRQLVFLSVDLI